MKNLIVSGKPGCGKTTLIEEAVLPFKDRLGGFVTREAREGGARIGFELVAFDGRRGVFASKRIASAQRINKYGVDLAVLDDVGVGAMRAARQAGRLVVVDEIGAMEMLSERFREEVFACLNAAVPVLATCRAGTADFAAQAAGLADTELLELTREGFNAARARVRYWLEGHLGR